MLSAGRRPGAWSGRGPVTDEQSGDEPEREQVGEDQVAARAQDLRTLGETTALVLPVVERRRADNEVKGRLWKGQVLVQEIGVIGSFVGTRADLAETYELHASGRTTVVKETWSLEQVNEAMAEVGQGKAEARLVFDLRPAP